MRVSIYALTLALFILASFSVPIEVLGAPAPTYTPGVKPGDSWSYGDFGCAGAQCTTGGFTSIAAVAVMVQSVVGPTVTSTETVTYTDGRALTDHFVINVQTGVGN